MLLRLFLLFTIIPIAEITLLIRLGGVIGLGPTLGLVVATGAAGAWLARREGLKSWLSVQGELAAGKMPGEEMVHALLILVAGIVLLTPGVLTDAVGLALLVRPVRRGLIARLRGRFSRQIEEGSAGFVGGPGMGVFWEAGGPGASSQATGRPAGQPGGREIIVEAPHPADGEPAPGAGEPDLSLEDPRG